jgi:hypothetical protein
MLIMAFSNGTSYFLLTRTLCCSADEAENDVKVIEGIVLYLHSINGTNRNSVCQLKNCELLLLLNILLVD